MNDQHFLKDHHNRQRQQTNNQREQTRNGTPRSDPSLVRRHTTPDMAASAAYGMVLCGTDELEHRYRGRIEKVKFGVPVNEAFSPDIPATLLVLLLKINKEGPLKKDIWRAPGNQAQVRKLSNIMQHGRLVNISNISVYTAASVIKRFLAKLPGGILGAENEKRLFECVQQGNIGDDSKRELFCRIISNLPIPSQHLLVLLFGTFRVITDSAETFGTKMTPDAIGISVAPSLFHTCIHDGQRAKLEDVLRYKIASQVISEIVRGFGYTNLFPRECYEFYARITGRTLRVDEQWHFSFQLPSRTFSQPSIQFERSKSPEHHLATTSAEGEIHETAFEEFCEEEDIFGDSLPELAVGHHYVRRRDVSKSLDEQRTKSAGWREILMRRGREERLSTSMGEVVVHSEEEEEGVDCGDKLRGIRDYLESTRSLTNLEWVHERQTRRMQTRSEWFLSPITPLSKNGGTLRGEGERMCCSRISQRFSASPIHLRLPLKKRTPTREECTSSGDEEMMCCCSSISGTGGVGTGSGEIGCGRSGCAAVGGTSTDTSMKCSPRRPDSCCTTSGCGSAGDAQMKSHTGTEEEEAETSDDDAFLANSSIIHQRSFHSHLLTNVKNQQQPHSPTSKMFIGRQPFQLLQERQYSTSTTDGSLSAQVTPSAVELCSSGKSVGSGAGRQRFFGSGEQEGGLQALPELVETTIASPLPRRFSASYIDISPTDVEQNRTEQIPATTQPTTASSVLTRQKHQQKGAKLIQTMSSGSSGSGSGGSGTSAQTVIGVIGGVEPLEISQQQQARLVGTGVVRRRSWRIHYTRPKNKSLDSETAVGVNADIREKITASHSIPLRCSSPLVFSRRHSSNGDAHKNKGAVEITPTNSATAPSSAREALLRRKSSTNNNTSKTKPPVQTRRSTQI